MYSLASKLRNRVEIYRNNLVQGELGDNYEPKLLKKVWANIIPMNGSVKESAGETEYSELKFKIIIRKTDIKQKDYIIYKGQKYEFEYIIPEFTKNSYLEIRAILRVD